jgi:hypothetical protein
MANGNFVKSRKEFVVKSHYKRKVLYEGIYVSLSLSGFRRQINFFHHLLQMKKEFFVIVILFYELIDGENDIGYVSALIFRKAVTLTSSKTSVFSLTKYEIRNRF